MTIVIHFCRRMIRSNPKTPATRAKRVDETARLAGRGERANQWKPKPPPAAD